MSRNVTIRYERRILRMGKHMVSSDAQCPFYKGETRNVVYCEGVRRRAAYITHFPAMRWCISQITAVANGRAAL